MPLSDRDVERIARRAAEIVLAELSARGIIGETGQDKTELVSLKELAKRIPRVRGAKPVNYTTIYRWATIGLQSRSGRMMRLVTTNVGGTLCASLDDLNRFFDSLDDIEWTPPVYRNKREEERMKREADEAFRQAM